MIRRSPTAGTGEPGSGERVKVRRDVNLTAVILAVVIVGGVLAALWIGAAGVLAYEGLDTRGMLTVRLGPQEWAVAGGFTTGLGAFLAVLKRMGRNERALRRDVPDALAAQQKATADEHAATRAEVAELRGALQAVTDLLAAREHQVDHDVDEHAGQVDVGDVEAPPVLSLVPAPRVDTDEVAAVRAALADVPRITGTGQVVRRGRRAADVPHDQLPAEPELEAAPGSLTDQLLAPAGYAPPPDLSWSEIIGERDR